jgi:hypothetical protein
MAPKGYYAGLLKCKFDLIGYTERGLIRMGFYQERGLIGDGNKQVQIRSFCYCTVYSAKRYY